MKKEKTLQEIQEQISEWSSVKISDSNFEKIPVRYATACCANSSVR